MSENISLTIPLKLGALRAAGKMLTEIAKGLEPMNFGDELVGLAEEAVKTGDSVAVKISEPLRPLPSPTVNIDVAAPGADQTVVATVDNGTVTDVDELDAAGQPWDGRIHPKSRAKIAKTGLWKKIRGIETKSPGLVESVEAEHAVRLIQPLEFEIGNDGEAAPVTPPSNAAAVFANVAPPPTPVTPPEVAQQPITFAEMIQKITPRTTEKPEFVQTVTSVLAEFSTEQAPVTSLPQLIGRDDIIPAIAARLDELWQD